MTGPLEEALANSQPEQVTSVRIDKLKDGGFVVGTHLGGTFASESLEQCLMYIRSTLDP